MSGPIIILSDQQRAVDSGSGSAALEQHKRIVAAIQAKDKSSAWAAMQESVEAMAVYLAGLPPAAAPDDAFSA